MNASATLPRKPLDNPPAPKWPPPSPSADPAVWEAALRVIDLGWVTDERLADVIDWLASHWRGRPVLDAGLRAALNEGLAPAVPDDTDPDVRDWVTPLVRHVQRATGLEFSERLRELVAIGVIETMLVLEADAGRGRRVADRHRLAYARDEDRNRAGGLRAALAANVGVDKGEARKVALLLLGTAALDKSAYPHRDGQLGASGALVSSVLRLPVTVSTALAWAHTATRAVHPQITVSAMRALVSRPLRKRYSTLPAGVLPPAADDRDIATTGT